MMKLIVGLGNPGPKYRYTRHNVGFLVVDQLAKTQKIKFAPHRHTQAETATAPDFTLAKPTAFMNNSGTVVEKLMRQLRLKPTDLLVVYDDVDLPFGKIRFRSEGSSAGHKGLQSIIDQLGTPQLARVRVGVGRLANTDTSEYVLQSFTPTEKQQLPDILKLAIDKILEQLS